MIKHPLAYFTPEDNLALGMATTFVALRDVAFDVLSRMPGNACMVCGPITSGGAGNLLENLNRFNRAIDILSVCGENVFSQMPFELPLQRMRKGLDLYESGAELLNTFYLPIFSSGRVTRLCFLSDWKTSLGATWEHDRAIELGLEIKEFKKDFDKIAPDISQFFV